VGAGVRRGMCPPVQKGWCRYMGCRCKQGVPAARTKQGARGMRKESARCRASRAPYPATHRAHTGRRAAAVQGFFVEGCVAHEEHALRSSALPCARATQIRLHRPLPWRRSWQLRQGRPESGYPPLGEELCRRRGVLLRNARLNPETLLPSWSQRKPGTAPCLMQERSSGSAQGY